MRIPVAALLLVTSLPAMCAETAESLTFANVDYQDTAAWKPETVPDARYVYGGESPAQFADLRLPDGLMPASGLPVIVFIHGGAWRSDWSKNYSEPFVEALTREGFATWDLEFRRLGHVGGGYPGTFEDVADGLDYLRTVAESHPLDLEKVIVVGHSSGGHLALWAAGRHRLPDSGVLQRANPLAVTGVISLAGVNDLELSYELGDRTDVLTLLGVDSFEAGAQRFRESNPARLLPFGVPQILMIGSRDQAWRLEMNQRYADHVTAAGDLAKVVVLDGANHMDITDARSGVASSVAMEARSILGQ